MGRPNGSRTGLTREKVRDLVIVRRLHPEDAAKVLGITLRAVQQHLVVIREKDAA